MSRFLLFCVAVFLAVWLVCYHFHLLGYAARGH